MDEGIPALCWKMKEETQAAFSLYDLADKLRARGWQVPAYSMPANREDLVVQRILVRNGVSRDLASLLLADMKAAIEVLEKHPPEMLNQNDQGGFRH